MTPKWILWRIITTSWKFLSRRIFLKRKFYLITGRFSQNQRVVRPRRTNDKARFVLCFIANCFITGTIINGDGVTQFQQNQVNPCLMLTMPTRSFRNHIHDERLTIMLPQHWCNSDANSPVHEECEHDGPKVTTSTHVGNTMKDDIEIYGVWWSQVKLKDHKSKNNFRRSSKYQSEATMKNQRLRANQVKEC